MCETWILPYLLRLQIDLRIYLSIFSVLLNKPQNVLIHLKHKSQEVCPLIYISEITFYSISYMKHFLS